MRAREMSPDSPSIVSSTRISGPTSQTHTPRAPSRQHTLTNGHHHSSPITSRHNSYEQEPSPPLQQGTESTVSTTAPSTVWDELDDLKSRIRKLEGTGKPPVPSGVTASGVAPVTGDRPRTATTTVTTVSSSPKRARGTSSSPIASNAGAEETPPHPLLSSALGKAKDSVSLETYHALEAVASDALTLAKMTHSAMSTSKGALSASTPIAIDRQLKRKADGLCRNLTELCIALSASLPSHDPDSTVIQSNRRSIIALRPGSRDASSADPNASGRFPRARSLEPEQATPPPSASARVLSRLEARRTSLLASGSPTVGSPTTNVEDNPTSSTTTPGATASAASRDAAPTPTQATLSRTSTVLGRIQRHALAVAPDGPAGIPHNPAFEQHLHSSLDDRNAASGRPVSRAFTDLGRSRSTATASRRASRDYYTSSHPLPNIAPREALPTPQLSQQYSLPQPASARRSYLSRVSAGPTGGAPALSRLERGVGVGGSPAERSPSQLPKAPSRTSTQRQSRLASTGSYGMGAGNGNTLGARPERRSGVGLGTPLRTERGLGKGTTGSESWN